MEKMRAIRKIYERHRYDTKVKHPSFETEMRAHRWTNLLGEELRDKLIQQAHKDALIYDQLVKEESTFNRIKGQAKRRSQKNASRNKLARSASAAT